MQFLLTNVIDICYSVLCNVHFELIVLFAFHSCPLYAAEIRGAPDPDPAGYPVNLVDPARIRPDPMYLDPVWIRIRPDLR